MGLGAGVGGDAGADGRRLCGILEGGGLEGSLIARGGLVEDMGAFRLLSDDGAGKLGGGGGREFRSSMSESSTGVELLA